MKRIIISSLFALLLFKATAQNNPERKQPPPPPPFENGAPGDMRGHRMMRGDRKQNMERIELLKVQFITEKLGLTKAEAEQFWPINETYKQAVQEIIKTKAEDEIVFQEAMLNARKKYKTDLKPVLKSEERVNNALRLEIEFLRKIHFEMNRRRGF